MTIEQTAKEYAIKCHKGTNHTYDGKPYDVHLEGVYWVAKEFLYLVPINENEQEVLAACWAHDVIEDCRQTYNDVKKVLGENVAGLVYACTNEKGKTRKERANEKFYMELCDYPMARFVKLCDRIANMRYSIQKGSPMALIYAKEAREFTGKLYSEAYLPMIEEIYSLADTVLNNP